MAFIKSFKHVNLFELHFICEKALAIIKQKVGPTNKY